MTAGGPPGEFVLFAPAHRRIIVVALLILSAYLVLVAARHGLYVSDPQPHAGSRASEVADRIDPNTADAPTLAALPQLGQKRARDIIDYRERALAADPGRPAFSRAEDLLRIRGVGYAMMTQLRPFLRFPATRPTIRE